MFQLKRILYRIRIKLLVLRNKISYFFLKKHSKKINIVSSPKYKNKRKEDLTLQKYLLDRQIPCKIISWEEESDASINVIRSVWGYHKNLSRFKEFLEKNQTIHSKKIILDNMDKEKQYRLLQNNHIPTIETEFIEDITKLGKVNGKHVIKPVISASGNDTHIIDEDTKLEEYQEIKNWMVQPYISGIQEGELSVILINQKIEYGIIRHPGVFTSYQKEKYVPKEELSKEVVSISQKIKEIKDYQEAILMRIDFIKDQGNYKVLEVELVDPDLFIEVIPDKTKKKEIYQNLVNAILKSRKD